MYGVDLHPVLVSQILKKFLFLLFWLNLLSESILVFMRFFFYFFYLKIIWKLPNILLQRIL